MSAVEIGGVHCCSIGISVRATSALGDSVLNEGESWTGSFQCRPALAPSGQAGPLHSKRHDGILVECTKPTFEFDWWGGKDGQRTSQEGENGESKRGSAGPQ